MRAFLSALAVLAVSTLTPAHAADDDVSAFAARLAGHYDSLAHKQEDEAKGLTGEMVHGWVSRRFTPIDAPAVGDTVLVATVRYNGPDGVFDKGEFQVWTVTAGAEPGTVVMTPRGLADPERYMAATDEAATYASLTSDDLVPPHGAAGCPIVWRRDGEDWTGYTDPATCISLSTQRKVDLGWEWIYRLNDDAMWIDFAGFDQDGAMVYGRTDREPWRLDRQS